MAVWMTSRPLLLRSVTHPTHAPTVSCSPSHLKITSVQYYIGIHFLGNVHFGPRSCPSPPPPAHQFWHLNGGGDGTPYMNGISSSKSTHSFIDFGPSVQRLSIPNIWFSLLTHKSHIKFSLTNLEKRETFKACLFPHPTSLLWLDLHEHPIRFHVHLPSLDTQRYLSLSHKSHTQFMTTTTKLKQMAHNCNWWHWLLLWGLVATRCSGHKRLL